MYYMLTKQMLTGSTSKAEQSDIYERIQDGPRSNGKELKVSFESDGFELRVGLTSSWSI